MKYYIDYNNSILAVRIHSEQDFTRDFRSSFQRDRDRIMHSRAFRRMMHKTQIFNPIADNFRR